MIATVEIGSLIDRDPTVRAARPKIAGTGVTVMRVVGWYKMGLTPEEIAARYGHINLAQVQAALSYYHANVWESKLIWPKKRRLPNKLRVSSNSGRRREQWCLKAALTRIEDLEHLRESGTTIRCSEDQAPTSVYLITRALQPIVDNFMLSQQSEEKFLPKSVLH